MTTAQLVRKAKSLDLGESCAVVVVDARDYIPTDVADQINPSPSIRIAMDRGMDGDWSLRLETFDGEWYPRPTVTQCYSNASEWKFLEADALPRCIHFLHAVAELERPEVEAFLSDVVRREFGTASALDQIKRLQIGGRYVEENAAWGPLYIPGNAIEPDDPQYHTHTYRFVVERKPESAWGKDFRFFTQVRRGVRGDWVDYDLCMNARPSDPEPFERDVRGGGIAAHLAMFRGLLDAEAIDLKESPDVLSEREEWGITDEHLRTGTLSEKSLAELSKEVTAK